MNTIPFSDFDWQELKIEKTKQKNNIIKGGKGIAQKIFESVFFLLNFIDTNQPSDKNHLRIFPVWFLQRSRSISSGSIPRPAEKRFNLDSMLR